VLLGVDVAGGVKVKVGVLDGVKVSGNVLVTLGVNDCVKVLVMEGVMVSVKVIVCG
jgi:hypothetical protein